MATGRPTKYSDNLVNRICVLICEGQSLNKICKSKDMPDKSNVFEWLGKFPEFRDKYDRAVEERAERYAEEIIDLKNNRTRTVWIPTNTLPLFRQLKATAGSKMVFTKPDGSMICHTSVPAKMFRTFQKNAGVPVINFHGLRHTYASHYMINGGNIYELSKLLGHSGVEITQKYAHLSEDALKANQDRVSFNIDNVTQIHSKFTPNNKKADAVKKLQSAI